MTRESILLRLSFIIAYSSLLLVSSFQPKIGHRGILNCNPKLSQATARRLSLQTNLIYPEEERRDDNLARWERMYSEGDTYTDSTTTIEEAMMRSAVRVITFDLDNTLWKTSGCIGAANDALAAFLDKYDIAQPKRVETLMGDLFQADKKTYAPLDENPKGPVLLTQLRTDAIQQLLQDFNGYTEEDASAFAKEAFQCWTKARHDAIPDNFAGNVLGCLEKISTIKTAAGNPVLIGAITDGNSDPRNVDVLKDYFDFCVNAETVGVAKPDSRVYLEAIRLVVSHPSFQDLGRKPSDSDEQLEFSVGPYWVHIGDDFSKDIVPAKGLNMRTIWAQELIREKLLQQTKIAKQEESRKVEDFVKEVSDKQVIEMTIGAGDYLVDGMTREFADRVADEFDHLSEILWTWHVDGTQANQPIVVDSSAEDKIETAMDFTVIPPSSKSSKEETKSPFGDDDYVVSTVASRTFRLTREDYSMDVPAPFKNREKQVMKDIMTMAQLDKSSGVFSFPPEEVEQLQQGKLVLMVEIGNTGIKFGREIFVGMTVDEILALSEENPVNLKLFMQKAVDSPSFDLF
jgi:FMN phosphatase YigB (HAD superfamily)